MQFSEEQLKKIQNIEQSDYVTQVSADFYKHHLDKLKNLGTLDRRLESAFQYVLSLGFTQEPLIRSFLFYEACSPDFHLKPEIRNMLEEKNRVPEQQYQDFLRIAMKLIEWRT
ncbi:hypothetical protein GKR56_06950 [Providencia alcalifaciens]|uniref:Uncharacterized protein n=1 Tax=Providencia alcalifaciens DSM 30120 TaxID=520999 RepID=B6XDQ5_9GAMM|nr:hypothetical protein [Providencia alcalifaciens]ATG15959.1 hypothetical protein CO695_06525 [Providencia alcalifaciens]EEB46366.1 hypothetical protein PROVALCAL_01480 [Providencia alcalifaciens DSM 30120]MTC26514.1 hypothetical protein [Providencia alcalifaciens]MTC52978.1 hypothetical protein [Providencia alcalifaciens]CAG9433221.1 hypothetical protein NVI2019_NGLDDFDA_03527 [Providencia alcalifaciens]